MAIPNETPNSDSATESQIRKPASREEPAPKIMGVIERWASFIRDIFLIGGVPTLITIGWNLYHLQVDALKARSEALEAQNNFRKETQFDRAATLLEGQKKDYEYERQGLQKKLDQAKQEGSASEEKVKELQAQLKERSAKMQAFETSRAFLKSVIAQEPPLPRRLADLPKARWRVGASNYRTSSGFQHHEELVRCLRSLTAAVSRQDWQQAPHVNMFSAC